VPCILPVLYLHHTNLIPYFIIGSTIHYRAVCIVTEVRTMALNTHLSVPSAELASRHPFGAYNFEVAARVLENFSTSGSDNRLDKGQKQRPHWLWCPTEPPIRLVWGHIPGGKATRSWSYHSHLSSADANIKWSCNPLSHLPSWRAHDTFHLNLQHGWREFLPIHQSVAVPDGVSVSSRQPVCRRTL
jgi:hypothetical protein